MEQFLLTFSLLLALIGLTQWFGPRFSGFFSGLPTGSVIILALLGRDLGVDVAVETSKRMLMLIPSLLALLVGYRAILMSVTLSHALVTASVTAVVLFAAVAIFLILAELSIFVSVVLSLSLILLTANFFFGVDYKRSFRQARYFHCGQRF